MSLPERPDLAQLRRKAKELRAREGIPLATAQLKIARAHGFASWPKLKAEVETLLMDREQRAEEFVTASITGRTGRAARLLTDDIARFDVRTAAVLGDVEFVREAMPVDLEDTLKYVTHSHWHRLDPARAAGLLDLATFLLDAGADPDANEALYGASGKANNPAMTELLLSRGANPDDGESLYHSTYHAPDHRCLKVLLKHGAKVDGSNAIGAILDTGDAEGLRLLLEAGGRPGAAMAGAILQHAIRRQCTASMVESLLIAGADPNFQGDHPLPPLRMAVRFGRDDVAELLHEHGAIDDVTDSDRFIGACAQADRTAAERLKDVPLTGQDPSMMVFFAELGMTGAVELMLDFGFPIDMRRHGDGATALHAAAYAGSLDLVRLLVERGADVELRDTRWHATPMRWAEVGDENHADGNWPLIIDLLAGARTARS
jgi:ankyrin repeat protein